MAALASTGPAMADSAATVTAVCTHEGCTVTEFQNQIYVCPCHGSQYDTSGRIRKGPAPKNLAVPEYLFSSDTLVKIG